jgi:hypothetical protein
MNAKGSRQEVTRTGTKRSGIKAHIRGWDVGVFVEIKYNGDSDCDEVYITKTTGSNGNFEKLVCCFNDLGDHITAAE